MRDSNLNACRRDTQREGGRQQDRAGGDSLGPARGSAFEEEQHLLSAMLNDETTIRIKIAGQISHAISSCLLASPKPTPAVQRFFLCALQGLSGWPGMEGRRGKAAEGSTVAYLLTVKVV